MINIVGVMRPFLMNQTCFVYENGNKIDVVEIQTKDFPEKIIELSQKYNTLDVTLLGSKVYSKGIKKQIEKAEIAKYEVRKLNIKLN